MRTMVRYFHGVNYQFRFFNRIADALNFIEKRKEFKEFREFYMVCGKFDS